MLKKLVFLYTLGMICLLGSAQSAFALDPLYVDFGDIRLHLPLQAVDAIQMYDFKDEKGFTGAETVLVSHGDLSLTAGAATGYSNGVNFPFVALQTHLSNKLVSIDGVKFGVWYGHDYSKGALNKDKIGLEASIALW